MQNDEIAQEALRRIQSRRIQAQAEQIRRSEEIREKIPETAELMQQLRSVCMSVFSACSRKDRLKQIQAIRMQSEDADRMLKKLLTDHGYPEDYLDIHYSCGNCEDTGFFNGERCSCLIREIGTVCTENLNARSQLPLCTFSSFSLVYYNDLPKEEQEAMKRNLRLSKDYAKQFRPEQAKNLLMMGGTGLGKTHLSLSIASVVLEKGYTVVYDFFPNLLYHIQNEQFHSQKKESDDIMETLFDCDLLILDDLGTESTSDYIVSLIYTLINGRLNAGKPMIINTNLSIENIEERYGGRLSSRIFGSFTIMPFHGSDIRLKKALGNRKSNEMEDAHERDRVPGH